MNKLSLNSYAKLNLYLEVLSKRKDNYHDIKTLFERISLSDKITIRIRRDKKIKITCNLPDLPCDKSNLVYRSVKLLQDGLKINRGADIRIIKRIPVGSGLGGGSSNAAAVLVGLNELWKLNLTQDELISYGRKIGCDVPFFIHNIPFAQGSSRGDRIKPLKELSNVRLWHILVVPKMKVSTPLIYTKWDNLQRDSKTASARLTPPFLTVKRRCGIERAGLTKPKYDVKIINLALRKKDIFLIERVLFNSLEEITANLYPEVKRIKERLIHLGVKSILMSGSGPAVFGIVSSRREGQAICRHLKKVNRSWRVFVTMTV